MPRLNTVKRAQQRYETKPVIDPATGEQKVVPMMSKRTGEQKVTKHGKPVVLKLTERDLERPLPMPSCDYPACPHPTREITVGSPYKWIQPAKRPMRSRHADCPAWNVWEYSSSLSARIAQLQHDGPDEEFDSVDDARAWAESKAGEVREIAEEKQESADSLEEGFGHPTSQSEELAEVAAELEGWADELENVDLPEPPDCDDCESNGCEDCLEERESWQEELRSTLGDLLESSPV